MNGLDENLGLINGSARIFQTDWLSDIIGQLSYVLDLIGHTAEGRVEVGPKDKMFAKGGNEAVMAFVAFRQRVGTNHE